MDPSHARKHSDREIEVKALEILGATFPVSIPIPVDIDHLAEQNEIIDEIAPIALLEHHFNVAALLYRKPNGHAAIIVDENTLDHQPARASFSIAHKFAHVILHYEIWCKCETLSDTLKLHERIKHRYRTVIERDANRFASSILMPSPAIHKHVPLLYKKLVDEYGFDPNYVLPRLSSLLANEYKVSTDAMQIRLKELDLDKKLQTALSFQSPYLDI